MSTEEELHGCSFTNRPVLCKYEANVCCIGCDHQRMCLEKTRLAGHKVLPCTEEVLDVGEACPYAI